MRELKLTVYKKEDDGSTAIYHMQWDETYDSDIKKETFNKIINLIKESNIEMREVKDHLKELRK